LYRQIISPWPNRFLAPLVSDSKWLLITENQMNNIGMATSDWRGRKDVTLDPFQGESFNEDSLCKIEEQSAGE
jgi:hypothetical protein